MAKKTERYVGFYLIEGMWPIERPDLSYIKDHNWVLSRAKYWTMVENIVFEYKLGSSKIVVFGDGLIAFTDPELSKQGDNDKFFERIEKYTEILNALFVVFVSEITKMSNIKFHSQYEVTHHDIIPLTYEDGKQISMGIPNRSITNKQLDFRSLSDIPSGYVNDVAGWVDRFDRRPVVPADVLEKASKQYFKISTNRDGVRMLARANKAVSEYASTSFSNSILASWIYIEGYLFRKIETYMKTQGSAKFPRKRRESLMEQTSAQVIEFLEIAGEIDKPFYESLNKIRKIRNDIVHDGISATAQEASDALVIYEKVIDEISSEKVLLNTGITMGLF